MAGALLYYYEGNRSKRVYDITNEIATLSTHNLRKQKTHQSQFYNIQPMNYSKYYGTNTGYKDIQRNGRTIRKETIPLTCPANKCEYYKKLKTTKTIIIASKFNKNHVSIKFLRKTETDFGDVYTVTAIMLTDNGGLPLGAFPNLDLEQFFDGTYFPPLYCKNQIGRASCRERV